MHAIIFTALALLAPPSHDHCVTMSKASETMHVTCSDAGVYMDGLWNTTMMWWSLEIATRPDRPFFANANCGFSRADYYLDALRYRWKLRQFERWR